MKIEMRHIVILLLLLVVMPLIVFSGSASAQQSPSAIPTPTPVPANYTTPTFPSFFNCTFGTSIFPGADPVGVYSIHVNPFYQPPQAQTAKPVVQFATATAVVNCVYNDDGTYTMNHDGFSSFVDDGNYDEVYTTVAVVRSGNTTGTTYVNIAVTKDICYYDGELQDWGYGDGCYEFTSPLAITNGQSAADLALELCSSETHDSPDYSYYLTFTIMPDDSYDIGANNAFTIHTFSTGDNYYYD